MIPNKLILEVGARSETGYVRSENQDRMSWASTSWGQLYIVADGMGGHASGAKAAALTTAGLEKFLREAPIGSNIETAIRLAFEQTNKDVYEQAHTGDPATDGMGSTAVILLVFGKSAAVAHVGDSRAYLIRKGKLKQLTKDHTQVQRMVDAGILTPQQARNHPSANIIDRAIGNRPTVEVSIQTNIELSTGDSFLLCSDGLTGYCDDQEIVSVLDNNLTTQENADRLIRLALEKGGEDNVTVQLIKITQLDKKKYKKISYFLKFVFMLFLIIAIIEFDFFLLYPTQCGPGIKNDSLICNFLKHQISIVNSFKNIMGTIKNDKRDQPHDNNN